MPSIIFLYIHIFLYILLYIYFIYSFIYLQSFFVFKMFLRYFCLFRGTHPVTLSGYFRLYAQELLLLLTSFFGLSKVVFKCFAGPLLGAYMLRSVIPSCFANPLIIKKCPSMSLIIFFKSKVCVI